MQLSSTIIRSCNKIQCYVHNLMHMLYLFTSFGIRQSIPRHFGKIRREIPIGSVWTDKYEFKLIPRLALFHTVVKLCEFRRERSARRTPVSWEINSYYFALPLDALQGNRTAVFVDEIVTQKLKNFWHFAGVSKRNCRNTSLDEASKE